MYLKCIEITGFKSFPDKVNIKFTDGISAIVGPNGSGKSNICDAIRWVFGEQSVKTLRGGKMEDVIFGGTQTRKAVGFAQVDLTIDNSSGFLPCDFSEVTIARRYYRSGESEYFINRNNVRLKDVHELFMDTGLGRDGYSIIGQGRIAEILSQKSEERRQIFEEAAGISKYRYKKAESERKLKTAEENLIRLNDIIITLEDRIVPLEQQSKKAAAYLNLRDQLRELEVSLWLVSLSKIKENSQKVQDDFISCKNLLEQKKQQLVNLEQSLEQIFANQQQNNIDIDKLRSEIENLKLDYTQKNNDIVIMQNNIKNNIQNITRLEKESILKKSKFEDFETVLKDKQDQLNILINEKNQLEGKLSVLFTQGEQLNKDIDNINKEIEGFKDKIMTLIHNQSVLKAQLSSFESKNSYLEQRICEINKEAEKQEQNYNESEKNLTNIKTQLMTIDEQISGIDNGLLGYQRKLEGKLLKTNALKSDLDHLEKEISTAQTRLKMLNDLQNELDGYQKSVKFVINKQKGGYLKNICGTVADLFAVEPEFVIAIEVALGGAIQNIVTNTENDAKVAINMLKQQDGGRATFLPVSTIAGNRNISQGISSCEGFVGIAGDIISFDKKFEGIFLSLLGRTAIFDNIDNAMTAAKKSGYKTRIVTLDGQIINAGGAMTGGSFNKNSGILSRASQIKQLDKLIIDISKKAQEIKIEYQQQQKETDKIKILIDQLKQEQDEYKNKKIELTTEISYLEKTIEQIKQSQALFLDNIKTNKQELINNSQTMDRISIQISDIDNEINQAQNEVERSNVSFIDIDTLKQQQDEKITQYRLLLNSAQKDIESISASIEETKAQRQSLFNEDLNYQNEIDNLLQQNKIISHDIDAIKEFITIIKETQENKEKQYQLVISKKTANEAQSTKLQKEIKELNENILQNEREYIRLENRLSSMTLEKENIINKLWDTYELTLSSANKYEIKLDNVSKAESMAASLKSQIQKLGNINIDAIEEYKEVKQKLDFLKQQTDDLINSKNNLNNIIDDLTKKMKEIFLEQFDIINKTFGTTFYELFGGGKASLGLTDKNDVLNCGIEINVSPPGKNIKNISLLSGGEQAFCAIAIIFAILKVRPTPFCVFDEIEAALDDVNVERFSQYIKTFKNKTQFIVITHRRGTMEGADILYGVTMQEKGVSKLLSINIADVEKQLKL